MPSLAVAGAVLGAGVLSAGSSIIAGGEQESAADQAAAAQLQMFEQIRSDLGPYRAIGDAATNPLMYGLGIGGAPGGAGALAGSAPGSLIAPFQPTMAQLSQTPGYQFTLGQGLESTQNSFAAQGLGASGAAAKGAAGYASGLAANTYQQQFQNYWSQNQAILGGLEGAGGIGQSAANQTGAFGTAATSAANNFLTSGAAAGAAGLVGAGNAISGGTNNAALLYALGQSGMFGGPNSPQNFAAWANGPGGAAI
jgi:hypothetical protein